ncbi:flagellar basal body L-ring protein FlgH [Pandoraea bronchicola]|uniref:Flagellar L-ring protein n=1 Tax=Pandoraea bronchicola TaxID=2508287 RepID=A0A5E5BPQ6_9BURK|nr:flagellar basal body L-ring protein FlgH [Pandoraea bronchicola]VVE88271.1 flagellar basal body L-ring protein [Pandoraea bronchicola]
MTDATRYLPCDARRAYRRVRAVVAVALAAVLTGCAGYLPPQLEESDDLPSVTEMSSQGQAGGLFAAGHALSLTSDQRAFRAGDVLTIVLQEQTQASKRAGTRLDKRSDMSVDEITLMGNPVIGDSALGARRGFRGDSSSTAQNTLRGAITVVVHRVLPSGLLHVRGEKRLFLNQGEETVRVAGYVRAGDIDTTNRVSSLRVANARIQYFGTGALADSNNPGWLTRFFNSQFAPL